MGVSTAEGKQRSVSRRYGTDAETGNTAPGTQDTDRKVFIMIEYIACQSCTVVLANADDSHIDNEDTRATIAANMEQAGWLAMGEDVHMNLDTCEFCGQKWLGTGTVWYAETAAV